MAKMTLPTNFQDDIPNQSMGGKRRYRIINNTDGTISLEDVTIYDQVGSNFGAGQINQTNTAVNQSVDADTIIDDIDDVAANVKPHMPVGALAISQLYSEIAGDITNVRWNPESNRIQVNYNGEWVNYPPSFAGNSIYIIQDGIVLVPYTKVSSPPFTLSVDPIFSVEGTAIYYANGTLSYIRFDKDININEPYELVLEGRRVRGDFSRLAPYVAISGVGITMSDGTAFHTQRATVNSATGNIMLYLTGGALSTLIGFEIKNLYLRRIREG